MNMSPAGRTNPGIPEDQVSAQVTQWWLEVATSIRTGRTPRALRYLRWIAAVSPDDEGAKLWLRHLSRGQGGREHLAAAVAARSRPGHHANTKTGLKIGAAIVLSVLGLALFPFMQLSYGNAEWNALDTAIRDGEAPTPTATTTLAQTQEIPCAELPDAGAPLAATVSEQGIGLEAFERELDQFLMELEASGVNLQDSQTLASMPEYRRQVLDRLIENAVVQQAAVDEGITVTEEQVEGYLEEVAGQGEAQTRFRQELEAMGQTWEEFRRDACQELLRQSVLEQVTAEHTGTMEMVWARQIVVQTQQDAQNALARLAAGEDFSELAHELSLDDATREQGGDLGWFPRGLGRVAPEVEEAAFSGSPRLVQGPILVGEQYYLVQTVDLQSDRPVDPGMSAILRENDFQQWLTGQVAEAEITVYVDLYGLPEAVKTPKVVPETGAGLPLPGWLALTASGLACLAAGAALRFQRPAAEREEVS